MEGTSGHVNIGLAFLVIGIWHLFNCIKLHSLHPKAYTTLPWFPMSRIRYIEPITIMLVTIMLVTIELFVGEKPFARDGSIPTLNLRHIEHSIIGMSFFVYALFAILLDKIRPWSHHGLVHFLQAIAFCQQLLIFHLHSFDHMGVEGRYHLLLEIIIFVSQITTILAIGYRTSFLNSFVRAFSVVFQGVWLIVKGIMLWTPRFLPEGCFLKRETDLDILLCNGDSALKRAKALVNIEFGYCLIGLTVLAMALYLVLNKKYPQEIEYQSLTKYEEEVNISVELQEKTEVCQSKGNLPL